MITNVSSEVEGHIREVFSRAGARGFLHAREIGVEGASEVCVDADDGVVLASVFKIPVAVAYARAVVSGTLDERERTTITARYRIGGIGTAGCADDVQMSWRDAATFMLTMSDNAATDVLFHRLGPDAVDAVLRDVGLTHTRLIGCCEDLFASMSADLGVSLDDHAIDERLAELTPEQTWALSALDPARTTASTPRDITTLLAAIWTDQAAQPEACERVRQIMAHQIWPHRLSSGFGNDAEIAAKTGTLPGIRNEAGVITYPDGRRFAVAVFTRAESLDDRQPVVDASIGTAARIAIDYLR